MIRAVGLLSGGLDSTLAAKLLIDQGIEVFAVNFTSPFCNCTPKSAGCASVITSVRQLGGVPLKRFALGDEYLDIVKNPKFGHGKHMNPCIDCRIMKIRKAAEYMREIGASFLFTGEVLGQRPKSQRHAALDIIDRESGMRGFVLRPLCAQHLPETIPEKNGWVNRESLLAISGRSRKPQIALAFQKGINDYPCPAGGCLLTDERFAVKLKDYFEHTAAPSFNDIPLLKIGRHFRMGNGDRLIIARNEHEGNRLLQLRRNGSTILAPKNFSAPAVLFEGADRNSALQKMLEYTKHKIREDALIRVIDSNGESMYLLSEYEKSCRVATTT